MSKLTELTSHAHAKLKVSSTCQVDFAKQLHVMELRAAEVNKAVTCFPVFLTRNAQQGGWGLCAMTSFEQGKNLFVEDGNWQAIFQPACMQTYPFYLMRSEKDEKSYTIGIDEQSSSFSETEGEALFDEKGKASLLLSRMKNLVETDLKNTMQTYQFTQELEALNVFKAIDLIVHFADGSKQSLRGLHTLDEDKMLALSGEQLAELNSKGYLPIMHAMLLSIYQLNSLINKHNKSTDGTQVTQIKIEISREGSAS